MRGQRHRRPRNHSAPFLLVTIEDAAELRLAKPHVGSLEARPENVEGKGEVTVRDLVRNALRMRPDRIIGVRFEEERPSTCPKP
jgi:Flp pilus assembly CpaF family ATPase